MIQVCLRHGKRKQGIKGPRQKKFKPKDEVTKTGCSGLRFWMFQFFKIDRVRVGFEI
jgi:hypothetical protein